MLLQKFRRGVDFMFCATLSICMQKKFCNQLCFQMFPEKLGLDRGVGF